MDPMRAYLDNNVFSMIAAVKIPAEEVAILQRKIAAGEVVAPLSLAGIEELLGDIDRDRAGAVARLRSASSLVGGFHGMLKQPRDLLTDAIRAYAEGTRLPPASLPESERRLVAGYLSEVRSGSRTRDSALLDILHAVRKQKEECRIAMPEACRVTLARLDWAALSAKERRTASFEFFWDRAATTWADWFAEGAGADLAAGCRARGLDGLLKVRAVRLAVLAVLGLVFGQEVLGRMAKPSDGYDMWHAVLASTAEVFVTFDDRLAEHLSRMPIDSFRIIDSLGALTT